MHRPQSMGSFATEYECLLRDLVHHYDYEVSPRGQKIIEIENAAFTVTNPYSNFFRNFARTGTEDYLYPELFWYFSRSNRASFIGKFASLWNRIKNPDDTVNSAYGNLIFTQFGDYSQWQWAVDSLTKDPQTRQAVIMFNRPDFQKPGVKDFVCTMYGIFQIRDGKLNFSIHMRSQDIIRGLTYDAPFFMLLQQLMLEHLKTAGLKVEMGHYYHNVNSLHLYEIHFALANEMLGNEFLPVELPRVSHDGAQPILLSDGSRSREFNNAVHHIFTVESILSDPKPDDALPHIEVSNPLIQAMINHTIRGLQKHAKSKST